MSKADEYMIGGSHYKTGKLMPWDVLEDWMTAEEFNAYLRGNCIKYLARYQHKGKPLEDLQKAQHYLQKLIEREKDSHRVSGVPYTVDDVTAFGMR